jgi:hypothetical protein
MSKLERAYITTAGTTFKKVTASDGRTMHFKDGTPVREESFNAGQNHLKYEGEKVKVAVPSEKGGPGYVRKEVNPIEASSLGQELRFYRDDVPGEPRDTVLIDGEKYSTKELAELNDRIIERHGADAVFRYT